MMTPTRRQRNTSSLVLTKLLTCGFTLLVLVQGQVGAAETTAVQKKKKRRPRQYKRVHQRALKTILAGKAEAAVDDLQQFLKRVPDDGESHYMLAVAYAKLGQLDKAAAAMKTAIANGVPAGRFLAGTKTGLEPLRKHAAWKKLAAEFQNRAVHGPMLGVVSGSGVKIWVRTAGPADVTVEVSTEKDLSNAQRLPAVRSTKKSDFTAVVPVTGLKPSTRYFYAVLINGKRDGKTGVQSFRTFGEQHKPVKFTLAFGGGAGYVPQHERMWNTIRAKKPDVLLLLGDNVYIDDPKTPAMQHYCYYRRQSRPEFRRLVATTPVYTIISPPTIPPAGRKSTSRRGNAPSITSIATTG